MLISDQGTLVRTRVAEVSSLGRNTQGVTLIKLANDETLVGLERVQEPSEVEGEELEGEAFDGEVIATGDDSVDEPTLDAAAVSLIFVMEMSHRGKEFMGIQAEAEADLRELLGIPANYKVLFLQGGASSQFAMVPMNMLRGKPPPTTSNTGEWSKKAIKEARKKYGAVNVAASSEDGTSPRTDAGRVEAVDPDAAYVHYTPNETIGGVEFHWTPETGRAAGGRHVLEHPVAPDRRVEVRPDLRRRAEEHRPGRPDHRHRARRPARRARSAGTPTMFDYKVAADNDSMYNTPPTYAIYIAGLVFKWLKARAACRRSTVRWAACAPPSITLSISMPSTRWWPTWQSSKRNTANV
jgi:hypothetical protein